MQPALVIGRIRVNHNTPVYQMYRLVLHNVVVLYRRTITFSYIVSTNQTPRLHIPNILCACICRSVAPLLQEYVAGDLQRKLNALSEE